MTLVGNRTPYLTQLYSMSYGHCLLRRCPGYIFMSWVHFQTGPLKGNSHVHIKFPNRGRDVSFTQYQRKCCTIYPMESALNQQPPLKHECCTLSMHDQSKSSTSVCARQPRLLPADVGIQ